MTCFLILWGFAVCIFEELMIYSVCETFLNRRLPRKYQDVLITTALSLTLFMINQFHRPLLNVTATLITALCTALVLFTGCLRERLYCCSLSCLVLFATEYVGFRILGSDLSTRSLFSTIIATILIKLAAFIILRIICYSSKSKKVRFTGPPAITGCFFLYPLSCFALLLGLRYSRLSTPPQSAGEIILITGLFLLLFSNMLLFFLYDYVITLSGQMHEYELNQAKDTLTQQHFTILQEINNRYASLLHDVNNYIKTIQNLRTQEDSFQIQHISSSLMSEISEIRSQSYCTSPVINAILYEKQQTAIQKEIDFRIFVEPYFPAPDIPDNDLISLLCNLLDNALEAAVQCRNGFVDVQLFVNGAYHIIKIRNPYEHQPLRDHNHFFTSKQDSQNHGFGIRRVEAIAEKYHGTFRCTSEKSEFTAIVLLPLKIEQTS